MVNLQPSDRQSRLLVTTNPRQEARNPNLCFKEHFSVKSGGRQKNLGRSMNDLFRYLSIRWQIPKHRIQLKLCRSPIEMLNQETIKSMLTFSYPCEFKLQDLLTQNHYSPKHLMSYIAASNTKPSNLQKLNLLYQIAPCYVTSKNHICTHNHKCKEKR